VPNFHPPPGELDKSGPLTVLWVANFKSLKRPEVFVRLAAALSDCSNTHFVMIGAMNFGGSERAAGERLSASMAGIKNLKHLGQLPQAEVNQWLAASHLLVSTSRREGFPNTFIQAWLRGVPVVSLDVNPDGVLDAASTGVCVKTEEQLRQTVRAILSDRSRLSAMGERALEYAEQHHSMRNAQRVVELLQQLTHHSKGVLVPALLPVNNYYYPVGWCRSGVPNTTGCLKRPGGGCSVFTHHPATRSTPGLSISDEIELGRSTGGRQLAGCRRLFIRLRPGQACAPARGSASDICHGHNLYHHISPSILGLLKERRIPTVLTLHDLKVACPAYSMLTHDGICERCRGGRLHNVVLHRCIKDSRLMSFVIYMEAMLHRLLGSYLKCVDRFVVPSRFYQEKLVEWGLPRERLSRAVRRFRKAATRYQRAAHCHVGRLSRERGWPSIGRRHRRSTGHLIGTGRNE
jgi:glycosyltransferase involved in cell wall biosynthesis